MRNRFILLFKYVCTSFALVTLLSACFVTSVHPFYSQKDVYFDPTLIGFWKKADGAKGEYITVSNFENRAYRVSVPEGAGGVTTFDVFLLKINGQSFVDVFPTERNTNYEPDLPRHQLLRLSGNSSKIELKIMDYEWLNSLIKTDPNVVDHVLVPEPLGQRKKASFVLTATPAKLQKFVARYQNELFNLKQKSGGVGVEPGLELVRTTN